MQQQQVEEEEEGQAVAPIQSFLRLYLSSVIMGPQQLYGPLLLVYAFLPPSSNNYDAL